MVEFRDGRFVVVSKFVARELRGAVRKHFQRGRSHVPPHVRRGRVARGADKEDRDAA
jgi:hypothetical protein